MQSYKREIQQQHIQQQQTQQQKSNSKQDCYPKSKALLVWPT